MSTLTPMKAMDYLRSLEKETIARAYQTGEFTGRTDEQAAVALKLHARLSGIEVEIPPASLGRHRSTIGLVSHRSPRGRVAAAPAAKAAEVEPEAWQLELPAATLEERKVAALELGARALWAIRDVLARQAISLEIITAHWLPPVEESEAVGATE